MAEANALRELVSTQMKEAMKGGDKTRVGALRLVIAALKDREIEARGAGKIVSRQGGDRRNRRGQPARHGQGGERAEGALSWPDGFRQGERDRQGPADRLSCGQIGALAGGPARQEKSAALIRSFVMPQTSGRLFDELSRLITDAAGLAEGARREMDVVSREEFEAVKEMAAKARSENDALGSRIAALEAKLGGGQP